MICTGGDHPPVFSSRYDNKELPHDQIPISVLEPAIPRPPAITGGNATDVRPVECVEGKFKAQILDIGDALKSGGKILKAGQVTDGPHTEAEEIIGGYSMVQAESYEQALTVARECPITMMPGGSIEIRELQGL